jgi:23S rRNA pseudouridine1911/1915/1917 synthase
VHRGATTAPVRLAQGVATEPPASPFRAFRIATGVLLGRAGDLLFVEKPAGIPCFPPHGDPTGDCLLARLRRADLLGVGAFPPGFEGGLAHRLDTLTSGFLVVATTPAALAAVRAEWPTLRKFYRFRSSAPVKFHERVITAPIANHARHADRVVVQRWPRERHRGRWLEAWTGLRRLPSPWWEAEIRTGVRHQVRAHAAFAGLPLDGDGLYGGSPGVPALVHTAILGPRWSFQLPEATSGP